MHNSIMHVDEGVFGKIPKVDLITIYHASTEKVQYPRWNFRQNEVENRLKDFGEGFYTSPTPEYPIKLYCANDTVILNEYELNLTGLKVLRLKNDIDWLLAVAFHRRDFHKRQDIHQLRDGYRKWLANYDMFIGAISNDNFFSTITTFLDDGETDYVALQVSQMLKYEDQYVSKSDVACQNIKFIDSRGVDDEVIQEYRRITQL